MDDWLVQLDNLVLFILLSSLGIESGEKGKLCCWEMKFQGILAIIGRTM